MMLRQPPLTYKPPAEEDKLDQEQEDDEHIEYER
jgi:hypothetical protein